MACRWRIRHKLLLGLCMVVAIIALLLAGTLNALASYRATMQAFDSKLKELQSATDLREAIKHLSRPSKDARYELADFKKEKETACKELEAYRATLKETIDLGRDPAKGYLENTQVGALQQLFGELDRAILRAEEPAVSDRPRHSLREEELVKAKLVKLLDTSQDLINTINFNIGQHMKHANHDYKFGMAVVLTTSITGVLLMAGLLRFFYGWVFYPVRDLEKGAQRVAQGDFEHRIDVHSGDEMEDLASAFNHMMSRVHETYKDLNQQVNDRSRQLVRSERLASVGFLAAGVAHEINNPLASIAFCSEALQHRLEELLAQVRQHGQPSEQDCETVSKYLRMVQQEAFRCSEITKKLLEFSRRGEKQREQTDLGSIVQSVFDIVKHLPESRGRGLEFRELSKITAWVNAQEIKSVVLNLVMNALDSVDEGGQLTITQSLRDGMAEIVFKDTGCGMTEEVLENIFEPFFTRSRKRQGTGLGLSISHRIINQHGGEIEATSAGAGHGSTFTVHLPLQAANALTAQESEIEPAPEVVFKQTRRAA